MSEQPDFAVIDTASMMAVKVTGPGGIPDPDWHREAAESDFVFAEFLAEHSLIKGGISTARGTDLRVMMSDLTEFGQQFVRSDFHKWVVSIDKSGTTEKTKREKLNNRWTKFLAKHQIQSTGR